MATASQLRRLNQRRILESMLRLRRASRTQLAREAGMSQPTVSRIVDHLLTQGILTELEFETPPPTAPGANGTALADLPTKPAAGRPSTPLELDRTRSRFLAIQLGVRQTHISAVPVGIGENDAWDEVFETPSSSSQPDTAAAWLARVTDAIARLRPATLDAVVISLPGLIDESAGKVFLSPNLRWAEITDFAALLAPVVRAPVYYLQETRGLALGHLATSRDAEDFLLVDFGSGVGSAAVIGARTYQGPLPYSGEIGHTPVLGNKRPCGCGALGCLETRLSRAGLLASSVESGGAREWHAFLKGLEVDPVTPAWLVADLKLAAYTIACAANVLGLRNVVLTGYLDELPEKTHRILTDALTSSLLWSRFAPPKITHAPRHRLAGMVCTAMQRTY